MNNVQELIEEKVKQLKAIYPIIADNETYYSLWTCGKRDGIVSEELFEVARKYYGNLWHIM